MLGCASSRDNENISVICKDLASWVKKTGQTKELVFSKNYHFFFENNIAK